MPWFTVLITITINHWPSLFLFAFLSTAVYFAKKQQWQNKAALNNRNTAKATVQGIRRQQDQQKSRPAAIAAPFEIRPSATKTDNHSVNTKSSKLESGIPRLIPEFGTARRLSPFDFAVDASKLRVSYCQFETTE